MKLLVIILCLLSERYLIHAVSYQRFCWFTNYYQFIQKTADKNSIFANPWVLLAFIVLPILVITAVIYCLLHGIFFGFMGLLLSIVLFYYSLGPQNVFYPPAESYSENYTASVGNYFVLVNQQLFSVLFWYIIAGPVAALAYRLIALCRDITAVSAQANQLADLLEWIPARLTALLYLLVGNFQRGFGTFMRYIISKPDANNNLLSECGLLAVRASDVDEVPLPVAESLVEHAIFVALVFVALFTLVSWL